MASKQGDALMLRDKAWSLLRQQGEFQDAGGMGPHLTWQDPKIDMILRTPFRQLPQAPKELIAANPWLEAPDNLNRYGLQSYLYSKRS